MPPESREPLSPYLPDTDLGVFAPVAPPLKWAGGKGQLLAQMEAHFPDDFTRYHEPFIGGGAVFFSLVPRHGKPALLSDLNPELINFYRVLRESVDDLLREVAVLQDAYLAASLEEREEMYYWWRNADRLPDFANWTPFKRAVRFYFLNKTAYNGLYRINQKGLFNVPWGRYKKPALYRPEVLHNASQVLETFVIRLAVASFETVLDYARAGDFVYLDPPYVPLSATASFTTYTKEGFGLESQRHLADVCRELDRRNVQFLLSNSAVPIIFDLYRGFAVYTVQARRNINSQGNGRGFISEVLIRNYEVNDGKQN